MSSGSLASASLAQLATFAILARALGPAEFGLFVQITAMTAIAAQICGLGGSDCLIRRVSRDPRSYPVLLGHNLILICLTGSALVVAGTFATTYWVSLETGPDLGPASIVLLLTGNIVLVRGILLVETIFLSLGRTGAANRSVVGFALIRTATAAVACLLFGADTLAEWAIWQFSGNLLYGLLAVLWLRPLGRPRAVILREELAPGALFSSQFAVRAVRQNVDLFVIGVFAPIEVVGSYGVARRIMDSSYLVIDALNRLIYPRFARASRDGLHHALPVAGRVLAAALALGSAAAVGLFVLAPYLTLLFGKAYDQFAFFLRCLSGTIVFVAAWSVAIDLLGASGRQDVRTLILNTANLAGSVVIAAATWWAAPTGTFLALYAIEIAIAAAAWLVLFGLARRSRAAYQFGAA